MPLPDGIETARAAIQRRVWLWQVMFFAALIGAFNTVNVFTALSNKASDGIRFSFWEPMLWEYSSVVLVRVLIPGIAWFNRQVLICAHLCMNAAPGNGFHVGDTAENTIALGVS